MVQCTQRLHSRASTQLSCADTPYSLAFRQACSVILRHSFTGRMLIIHFNEAYNVTKPGRLARVLIFAGPLMALAVPGLELPRFRGQVSVLVS